MKQFLRIILLLIVVLPSFSRDSFAVVPTHDHVVIVVLENHGYNSVVGSPAAPYLNGLLSDPFTALFTNSVALTHPSQPNYLQLYSGSTQGVTDDSKPAAGLLPFTTANLGGALLNASRTFIGYSEDLPSVGDTITSSGAYARKHNPWVNWQGISLNGIPPTSNQPLTSFPTDFNLLPTVSYVIPNQNNDMHNGSDTARIGVCDRWMKTHLDPYIQWAKTHNSLFILTFDEDDNASVQHILTFFTGNFVQGGNYNNAINHYNLLRTIEDMYGLTHAGNAASATAIDYVWNNCNLVIPTVSPNGPLSICSGSSVTLTSSNALSYLWSNGATTQSVVVSATGNYSVTCTYATGCKTSSAPVAVSVISAPSDATLFSESMGTVSGTTAISTQEIANGFDNDNFTMSGTGDLRATTASSGYTTASGSANVFLTNTVGRNFTISGINTTGLTNLQVSFGIFKSTTAGTGSDLLVQVSKDGTNYTNLSFTPLPSGTSAWFYRTATGTFYDTTNLRLRFMQNGTATQYRIDDVLMTYSSIPTITINGPTDLCQNDSVTLTASSGINYLWSTGATTQSIIVHSAGSYTVNVNCITSLPVTVTVNNCPSLNLKVFIEGFYLNNGQMQPVLYTGNLNTDSTACDSITIELHTSASPYSLVAAKKTLLHKNGQASALFPVALMNSAYYIVVRHRNAVETWSKNTILFNSLTINFDFTIPDIIVNNPLPVLNSISPSTVYVGSPSFTLNLTGSNFIATSVARWNGASLTTSFVNSSQLTATVPAANIVATGTANVTVFNPLPGGGVSGSKTITIAPKKFLFDATKAETASNADWVIDEDASPLRFPTPDQSGITSGTGETFWTGALSSWGIALVKTGNAVETLPLGTAITYGNGSNAQDLSNYNVFVIDEPNTIFTAAEKTAILNFVNNGGGLFMVADHANSDRNGDGKDSRQVWNDLMNNNSVQNNPFGFSIDSTDISEISSNVLTNSGSNVVLNGSQGSVTQMQFNNGATITINTVANPNAKGLMWQNTLPQNSTHILCATSTFGSGRVFLVTDSSPMDDGTGVGSQLFVDWPNYSHKTLFMNASLWLAKIQ